LPERGVRKPRPVVTAGRLCRSRGGWAIKHHWFCLRRLDTGRNEPCHRIFRSRGATGAFGKGLDVRTVGVSFSSIITESLGEWVMSQRDARLERGYSSVGDSDRLSATLSPDEPDSTTLAAIGHAKLRRVVLVESDQYYREVLTVVLLSQGFVVHAFTDGASLLTSLATAAGADLAVLDWDLSGMPGPELLTQLRQHGVKLPVVFLADRVISGDDNDQCLLAPQEALDVYECMAFDRGTVDFIAKSRDRQVLVRHLRRLAELARPKVGLPG
jgi:CheY-like chemotaxis protein